MLYNIFPIIGIVVPLGIIIYILYKKLPDVSGLDVNAVPEIKQERLKKNLMEERLMRKLKDLRVLKLGGNITKAIQFVVEKCKVQQKKVQDILQQNKREKAIETIIETETSARDIQIEKMMESAENLGKNQESLKEAEQKYIDIIKIDFKNIEAYRGLGRLYVDMCEWENAVASLEHLLKIAGNSGQVLADDYRELAEAKRELSKDHEALHYAEKALELEPNNPKYLDLHLDISIRAKEPEQAKQSLRALRVVNPENSKLIDYGQKIKDMA